MRSTDWENDGVEPDYRFSLANERTFLAWIRTSLAVLAAGILLHQFAPAGHQPHLLRAAALGLTALSAVLAISTYFRWRAHEIAMRHSRPLRSRKSLQLLTSAMCLLALVLLFFLLPAAI